MAVPEFLRPLIIEKPFDFLEYLYDVRITFTEEKLLSCYKMLVSLTVGKVDAGVAVLLTEDKRLIEFPSILLPASITSGSIVDITVAQNYEAEAKSQAAFSSLQAQILNTYGLQSSTAPVLRLRNATQTSLVLEWDPVQLATSTLRSLALYRNGNKAGNIPRPMEMLNTKISGLAIDTEYSFHLVLRTSGGTFSSNTLTVKTQKMTDLTGITVTPGVLPSALRESLERAVERIGAKITESVRIDTTHFVCTEGRGREWETAQEMNIPVVRPEWVEGCEREGKIVGVRGYYLDANPKDRQVGSNPAITRNAGATSPASTAANAATSQTSLPSRADPRSSTQESRPSAEGEPGPEIPPTPSIREEAHQPAVEESHEEKSEEDEEEEEAESPISAEPESEPASAVKSTAEGDKDDDGSGEMDEVPL